MSLIDKIPDVLLTVTAGKKVLIYSPTMFQSPGSIYQAKFFIAYDTNIDPEKKILFANNTSIGHAFMFDTFHKFIRDAYHLDDAVADALYPSGGGGILSIDDKRIELSGDSQKFGPYDKQAARTVLEKMMKEYCLDKHELILL